MELTITLIRAVENIICERRRNSDADENIKLLINVDGLPISKSETNGLCLILGSDTKSETVYPIGAFYGLKKLVDANDFLHEFVEEAIIICQNGVKNKSVTLEAVICDVPAKYTFRLYAFNLAWSDKKAY